MLLTLFTELNFDIYLAVVSTLLNFTRMFNRAHEENLKQLELEKKKAAKEPETEKLKKNPPQSSFERLLNSSTKTVD